MTDTKVVLNEEHCKRARGWEWSADATGGRAMRQRVGRCPVGHDDRYAGCTSMHAQQRALPPCSPWAHPYIYPLHLLLLTIADDNDDGEDEQEQQRPHDGALDLLAEGAAGVIGESRAHTMMWPDCMHVQKRERGVET